MNPKILINPVRTILLLMISLTFGCQMENLTESTIHGTITVYKTGNSAIRSPLGGIKVYLINADFNADTVNYANNKNAYIDSTITGTDGKYLFNSVANGHYYVGPAVEHYALYRFKATGNLNSPDININGEPKEVIIDFESPEPMAENSQKLTIQFRLKYSGGMDKLQNAELNIYQLQDHALIIRSGVFINNSKLNNIEFKDHADGYKITDNIFITANKGYIEYSWFVPTYQLHNSFDFNFETRQNIIMTTIVAAVKVVLPENPLHTSYDAGIIDITQFFTKNDSEPSFRMTLYPTGIN